MTSHNSKNHDFIIKQMALANSRKHSTEMTPFFTDKTNSPAHKNISNEPTHREMNALDIDPTDSRKQFKSVMQQPIHTRLSQNNKLVERRDS